MKKNKEQKNDYLMKDFDYTGVIASHYGFVPIQGPKITKTEESQYGLLKNTDKQDDKKMVLERLAVLNFYNNSHFQGSNQPALFYFKKPFPPERHGRTSLSCGLEILNNSKPLSEALAIKTAFAILEDSMHKGLFVEINCVGDKESFGKFEREIQNYLKKNISSLPASYRQKFKNNPHSILSCTDSSVKDFCENAPKPMNALNEESRIYFKEVLEFLDSFNIPYKIDHGLIPNKIHCSHLILNIYETIKNKKGESYKLLASGGRYNNLSKKIGFKKDLACFGMTINYKAKNNKKIKADKIAKPKFYMVQIGNAAKLKVLNVIENLRKEKIPVHHSLMKDKITMQISSAEYLKVSHILIIGQKEAMEGCVVVRSLELRDQKTIPMDKLALYLKNI